MSASGLPGWQQELDTWLEPFLDALGDKRRRRGAPLYLKGLIGPGDRKSIQPMAERVAPGDLWQGHQFVAASRWPTDPLEAVLVRKADALLGGDASVLIIDDTTLRKQGKHAVGVARQYSGAAGKRANRQTLVSLTPAEQGIPMPIAVRLSLPREGAGDPERCLRAGVPRERIRDKSKVETALEELDRVPHKGLASGTWSPTRVTA